MKNIFELGLVSHRVVERIADLEGKVAFILENALFYDDCSEDNSDWSIGHRERDLDDFLKQRKSEEESRK